jgi:hypothetical protein
MTSIDNKHLKLIEHAIDLSEQTLAKLIKGNSQEANQLSKQRLSSIQSIPFQQLDTDKQPELILPLQKLSELDKVLQETSEQVKSALEDELKSVKKSFSAAKAYQDVEQHNKN